MNNYSILYDYNIEYDHNTLDEEKISDDNNNNKLGARTLVARSKGSKNVTYRQQTTEIMKT